MYWVLCIRYLKKNIVLIIVSFSVAVIIGTNSQETDFNSVKQSLSDTLDSVIERVKNDFQQMSKKAQRFGGERFRALERALIDAQNRLNSMNPSTKIGQAGLTALQSVVEQLVELANSLNPENADSFIDEK